MRAGDTSHCVRRTASAAHGGHPYTDLAMLELFGTPFYDDILRGYGARCNVCHRSAPRKRG